MQRRMTTPAETSRCPQCGAELPPNAPQGLCPRCLLAGVDAPTDAGQPSVSTGPASAPPPLTEIAPAFPHLEILELIGQGGMGFVYKARQPRLDRIVALKVLPQALAGQPGFRERFTREGRMLARLNHPTIVTVFDFGESGGFFYLLMEFVDGVNLRQAMRAGRFTLAQALTVVPKICEALSYAHGEGVLHRDIKPENILLDSRGRVKIADFGIAKLLGEVDTHLTATDARLGTPHYMAPEQIERPSEVDHRADIYSLGVVFYEMLTGELPLGQFAPPSEKSPLDPRVDYVVMRALARERERRQQSAGEVKTQVENLGVKTPQAAAAELAGWEVRCLSCGKTKPLAEVDGARIDAASIGKRILLTCSNCKRQRWAVVERPGVSASSAEPANTGASGARPPWSGKALASALLAVPAWVLAFVGGWLIVPWNMSRRDASISPELLIFLGLCFIPPLLVSLLGHRALRDPSVRDGSKRGAWAAAFGTSTLPTFALQIVLCILAQRLPREASVLGLLAFPAGFAAGLWLAVRAHDRATGRSAAPWPARFAWTFVALYALAMLPLVPMVLYHAVGSRPVISYAGVMPSDGQLSQGAIDLVAVSRHPSTNQPWWRADGSLAHDRSFVSRGSSRIEPGPDEHAFEFVARKRDLPYGASTIAWQFEHGASWVRGGFPARASEPRVPLLDHELVAATIPRNVTSVTIKAGVGLGAWETVATSNPRGGLGTSRLEGASDWNISFGETVETKNNELAVHVAHTKRSDWETRVVAVGATGREITSSRFWTANEQTAIRFDKLSLDDVKELRFQVRRYEWVEFRNVALQPTDAPRRP